MTRKHYSYFLTYILHHYSSFGVSITSARDNRGRKTVIARQSSQTTVKPKPAQTRNNKNVTDVIYVAPKDAKAVRLELEKLGYFDSRYKLVKVELSKDEVGKKVAIGLPITQHCKSLYLSEGKEGLSQRMENLVIGLGEEQVPYSSSQMSKMANKAS